MKTITLNRTNTYGRAVMGYVELQFGSDMVRCATLENADYLIPAGTYPLRKTWSPRFNKEMPEICEVPEREGIRIHMGTKPEHSTGCVLMSAFGLNSVNSYINNIQKYYDNEEISIRVIDAL